MGCGIITSFSTAGSARITSQSCRGGISIPRQSRRGVGSFSRCGLPVDEFTKQRTGSPTPQSLGPGIFRIDAGRDKIAFMTKLYGGGILQESLIVAPAGRTRWISEGFAAIVESAKVCR